MKGQIAEYVISLYEDIPMAVYEGLLSVLCLGVVGIIFYYGLKRGWRKVAGLVLVEYVFLIYCSTVVYRNALRERGCELMPFWSYRAILEGRPELLSENIMNVVAFVPVGLMLKACMKGLKWWHALLIGVCLSVSIEVQQFVFKKGFSELDDVMHNTLGCMIGYGIYAIGRYWCERLSKRSVEVLKTRKLSNERLSRAL